MGKKKCVIACYPTQKKYFLVHLNLEILTVNIFSFQYAVRKVFHLFKSKITNEKRLWFSEFFQT